MKLIVNHIDDDMASELKKRGQACYKWRISNGISKKEMAAALKCSIPTVTKLETTGIMSFEVLQNFLRLNSGIGVQPKDFLNQPKDFLNQR